MFEAPITRFFRRFGFMSFLLAVLLVFVFGLLTMDYEGRMARLAKSENDLYVVNRKLKDKSMKLLAEHKSLGEESVGWEAIAEKEYSMLRANEILFRFPPAP